MRGVISQGEAMRRVCETTYAYDEEESETIEGAKSELEGYLETVNTWINDENWDTVLEEVSNEV